MGDTLKLFHTGFDEIRNPDVNYGRRNADFGGGFYLSNSLEFAEKWAGERKNCDTYINFYELDLSKLKVKRFDHSLEWFEYISKNRAGYADSLSDYDVIIGPIANDTLYDTYGIITSGLLNSEDALKLLKTGNVYYQINVKTQKAASQLKWLSSRILTSSEIADSRKRVEEEEEQFKIAFADAINELAQGDKINEILG